MKQLNKVKFSLYIGMKQNKINICDSHATYAGPLLGIAGTKMAFKVKAVSTRSPVANKEPCLW